MKRTLSNTEEFDLRQTLHVAILEALMSSRRWEAGDLVFQGGTSLHLSHGSPRFSEDLDFLVRSSLDLKNITEAIRPRLQSLAFFPRDMNLSLGANKNSDTRNPNCFMVTLSGPQVIRSVKVKVELWKTPPDALSAVKAVVCPVRVMQGQTAGMQTFVPTATLSEIYADKVFALAARDHFKARDVFDLFWLKEHNEWKECSRADMQVRLATYPSTTPDMWLAKAFARRQQLQENEASELIVSGLKNWLPSFWPLTKETAQAMAKHSIVCLEQGIDYIREIASELREENEGLEP